MNRPKIAVPIGDPAGVGPEITVMALADPALRDMADVIVIGDREVLEKAMAITGADLTIRCAAGPEEGDYRPGILNLIDLGGRQETGQRIPESDGPLRIKRADIIRNRNKQVNHEKSRCCIMLFQK